MHFIVIVLLVPFILSALTLEEAIDALTKNNLNIKIVNQDVAASQSKLSQRQSSSFGSFDLLAALAIYNDERTLAPIVPPLTNDIATSDTIGSLGVGYKVNLFNGMKTFNEIDMDKLSISISQAKQKFTQYEQIYVTQVLYLNILSLEKTLYAQEEYKKVLKNLKSIVQESVEYGKKPQLNLLKIDSQIYKTEEQITLLQTKIKISKSTLSVLIYGELKPMQELEDIDISHEQKSYLLENLPSIQISQYSLKKNTKAYQNAYTSYYPQVNFQASYIDNYGNGNKENISTATINLQWKIFDFGAREDGVQLAKIQKIKTTIASKKTQLEYENKIYEAKERIVQNEQLLKSRQTEYLVATKIKEIEELKYNEGQSSINDFLFASTDEKFSQSKYIEAKYKLIESQFYLEFLTKE